MRTFYRFYITLLFVRLTSMLKYFFLSTAAIIFSASLSAQPRSKQEMLQIASQKLDAKMTRATSEPIDILVQDEMYSILGRKQQGFVVVSNDKQHEPVLAYSTQTSLDPENIPCGMKWWLQATSASLKEAQKYGNSLSYSPKKGTKAKIEPLLTTVWDQSSPFNNKCPKFNEKSAPTGCVATAMAQVLNYHQYPDSCEGTGYYTKGESDIKYYIPINSKYDWSLFKDSYKNAFFISDAERDAVAQLMYDCGVASHMNYNESGSGTTIGRGAYGLSKHFKCDSLAFNYLQRDNYDTEEWLTIIRQELEAGRPVLYGGSNPKEGGHAFVINGIDEDDKVYVNWGWGGSGDCWCLITNLSISQSRGFNESQSMVTGFKKQSAPDPDETYRSLWALVEQTKFTQTFKPAASFNVAAFTAYNICHIPFYGSIGVYLEKTDGSESLFVPFRTTGESIVSPVESDLGYYVDLQNVTSANLDTLSVGSYYAYMASNALQDTKPQAMKYKGGLTDVYTITIAENRQLTIDGVEAVKNFTPTAIRSVYGSLSDAPVRYYDLGGHEVSGKTRGLLIVRKGNQVSKIINR